MSPRHPVHCVLPQKVRCHTQKVKCRGLLTVKRCTYTKGRTGGGKAYKAREIYCQKNTQPTSPVTRYNADPRRAHTLNAFSMEIRSDGCRHECLTQCRMSHSMPNVSLNAEWRSQCQSWKILAHTRYNHLIWSPVVSTGKLQTQRLAEWHLCLTVDMQHHAHYRN